MMTNIYLSVKHQFGTYSRKKETTRSKVCPWVCPFARMRSVVNRGHQIFYDWSACEDKFKIAVAVLRDDYKSAEKLMLKIGKKGELSKENYSSWPLFKTFRESKEFSRIYRKLFGNDFFLTKDGLQERLGQSQAVAAPDRQEMATAV